MHTYLDHSRTRKSKFFCNLFVGKTRFLNRLINLISGFPFIQSLFAPHLNYLLWWTSQHQRQPGCISNFNTENRFCQRFCARSRASFYWTGYVQSVCVNSIAKFNLYNNVPTVHFLRYFSKSSGTYNEWITYGVLRVKPITQKEFGILPNSLCWSTCRCSH